MSDTDRPLTEASEALLDELTDRLWKGASLRDHFADRLAAIEAQAVERAKPEIEKAARAKIAALHGALTYLTYGPKADEEARYARAIRVLSIEKVGKDIAIDHDARIAAEAVAQLSDLIGMCYQLAGALFMAADHYTPESVESLQTLLLDVLADPEKFTADGVHDEWKARSLLTQADKPAAVTERRESEADA